MAVTAHVFQQWAQGAATKLQNLAATDTLKVALSNGAGPVTQATAGIQAAKLFTDWTAIATLAEISGTGYTAGGATLSGQSVTTATNVMTFTATSPSWAAATFTANQAIFYDSSAGTEQLICWWDFGGAITVTASTFTLTISGSGLLTATAT
jgi:hypothetical protein